MKANFLHVFILRGFEIMPKTVVNTAQSPTSLSFCMMDFWFMKKIRFLPLSSPRPL